MKYTISLPQEVAEIYNLSANHLGSSVEFVLQEALANYINFCLKEKKALN